MFFRPEDGHDLPHNPFNAIVAPRPIGWIATRGTAGDNLAPYSFFNAVAYVPPQVMVASTSAKPDRDGTKDTMAQIRESGIFAVNVVGADLAQAMNATSAPLPAGVDEFAAAGLEKGACETIDCPYVVAAPAVLECRLSQIVTLEGAANLMAVGVVTGIRIDEAYLTDGLFDLTKVRPLTRLGYHDYGVIERVFEMKRPD